MNPSAAYSHDEKVIGQKSTDQLSESAKWRQQEEEWARAEEARWGSRYGQANTNTGGLTGTDASPDAEDSNTSPVAVTRLHPNVIANRGGVVDDSARIDAERFGKLRNFYGREGGDEESLRNQRPAAPLRDEQRAPYASRNAMHADPVISQQRRQQVPISRTAPNSRLDNSGRRIVSPDDGRPPYSTTDVTTTVAGTLRANHHYDDRIIEEHDVRMEVAGEQYNSVAERAGRKSRYAPGDDADPTNYGSPTAYLDNEDIRDEKLYERELKERIEQKNKEMLGQAEQQQVHEAMLKEQPRAARELYEAQPQIREEDDPNLVDENYVALRKPRSHSNSALLEMQAQQKRAKKQQSALGGILHRSLGGGDEADSAPRESTRKATVSLVKQRLGRDRPAPDQAIPLGAQGYEGLPPRPIARILDDTPDRWFEQYRHEVSERRFSKETQRRTEIGKRREQTGNSLGHRIKASLDDSRVTAKKRMQSHDIHSEDRHLAEHEKVSKARISKYFPEHENERFVCAFDVQALHHYTPIDGHLILTADTLMFVGKGKEKVEVAREAPVYDAKAPKPLTKKEHLLVAEAIPLSNILSVTRGAVVKNNGKVFIVDISDDLILPNALQLFTADQVNYQFRKFSHPCVRDSDGWSYDGRHVPASERFLNYFDHAWRAIGGGDIQNGQYLDY